MSSSSVAPVRSQRGFTLLEVMCALAILAIVTGFITQVCHQASEQANHAIDLRELREAADTVFRRLCYEDGRHKDGMRASLEDFYAAWAEMNSRERDGWRHYQMEFRRRARTAAGTADPAEAESLFGGGGGGTKGMGIAGSGTAPPKDGTPEDEKDDRVELVQLTLTIFHEDEPEDKLIVLQTYLPPQGTTEAGGGTGGGAR